MSKPYIEILDEDRKKLLPLLAKLPKGGVLGGGTALALQIGHRVSYDFDFFFAKPIPKIWLVKLKALFGRNLSRVMVDSTDELTVSIKPDIKLTLLYYPFPPLHSPLKWRGLSLMKMDDIASSKAYAVGRRGVWRDYVDLYFLLHDHIRLSAVIKQAERRFAGVFDARLFLEQLVYDGDLDDQAVQFFDKTVEKKEVMEFLKSTVEDYMSAFKK